MNKKILSTTYVVESVIVDKWLDYVEKTFLAKIIESSLVASVCLVRVPFKQEDEKSENFNIQIFFQTNQDLIKFREQYLDSLNELMLNVFGNKVLNFSLELDIVFQSEN